MREKRTFLVNSSCCRAVEGYRNIACKELVLVFTTSMIKNNYCDCAAVVWSRRCCRRFVSMQTSVENYRRNCSATGNTMSTLDFQRSKCAFVWSGERTHQRLLCSMNLASTWSTTNNGIRIGNYADHWRRIMPAATRNSIRVCFVMATWA